MEKKLRHSRQREMIYQYLLTTQEHPSAEMVYHALREEVQGLSLATVYRNLNLLEQLGKVRKVTAFQAANATTPAAVITDISSASAADASGIWAAPTPKSSAPPSLWRTDTSWASWI